MNKVLVIGATGFVGKAIVASLKQDEFEVVTTRLQLHESTNWISELGSVNFIVNAAGMAHVPQKQIESAKERMQQANHLGLAPLVKAFKKSKSAKALINISSVAASGWTLSSEPIDESMDRVPISWYGKTKFAGEELLLSESQNRRDQIILNLRPPLIIGENAKGNFARLLALATSSKWLPFGAVDNQRSLLCIKNLCEFIIFLFNLSDLKRSHSYSGTYFICDQQPISLKQILVALRQPRHSKLFRLNPSVLKRLLRPLIGKSSVDGLLGDLVFDTSKLSTAFNWAPSYRTTDELKKIARVQV